MAIDEGPSRMTEDKVAYETRDEARIAYKPLYEAQAARVLQLEDELRSLTREYDVWRERSTLYQEMVLVQRQLIAVLLNGEKT